MFIMPVATVQPELIGHVAEEAKLSPEAVELVLQLTAESIQQATERHAEIRLTAQAGSGKSAVLATLMMALAAAEQEGTVDAPTMAALSAFRNLVAHGRAVEGLVE